MKKTLFLLLVTLSCWAMDKDESKKQTLLDVLTLDGITVNNGLLYINNKNIDDLEGLLHIKQLVRHFLCNKNAVSQVPAELSLNQNFLHLAELSFYKNKITYIDPKALNLPNLESLDLSSNLLTSITGLFSALTKLERLYLFCNPLKKLHIDDFSILTKLSILFLCDAQLTELPDTIFGKNKELRKLNVSHNQLKKLPTLTTLVKLSTLDISNNQLKDLPIDVIFPDNEWGEINEHYHLNVKNNPLNQETELKLENAAYAYSMYHSFDRNHRPNNPDPSEF